MITKTLRIKRLARAVDFECCQPEARQVAIAGGFNNWQPEPLRQDREGRWKITLNLAPGRHEYRYWVDGAWQNDPACSQCVPNAFGSWNCVREVK